MCRELYYPHLSYPLAVSTLADTDIILDKQHLCSVGGSNHIRSLAK